MPDGRAPTRTPSSAATTLMRPTTAARWPSRFFSRCSSGRVALLLQRLLLVLLPPVAFTQSTFVYVSGYLHWPDARADCVARGGDLAIIRSSADESAAIAAASAGSKHTWIGFTCAASGSCADESEWAWADGSAVGYTNWHGSEPNGATEGCAMIKRSGAGWGNLYCSSNAGNWVDGYLCSTGGSSSSPPLLPPSSPPPSPPTPPTPPPLPPSPPPPYPPATCLNTCHTASDGVCDGACRAARALAATAGSASHPAQTGSPRRPFLCTQTAALAQSTARVRSTLIASTVATDLRVKWFSSSSPSPTSGPTTLGGSPPPTKPTATLRRPDSQTRPRSRMGAPLMW